MLLWIWHLVEVGEVKKKNWILAFVLTILLSVFFEYMFLAFLNAGSQEWIREKLQTLSPKLSPREETGAYQCSFQEQVVGIQRYEEHITIVFAHGPPLSFLAPEIFPELKKTIKELEKKMPIATPRDWQELVQRFRDGTWVEHQVLCIKGAFRDDYEEVYRKRGRFDDKLLGFEEVKR